MGWIPLSSVFLLFLLLLLLLLLVLILVLVVFLFLLVVVVVLVVVVDKCCKIPQDRERAHTLPRLVSFCCPC